MLGFIAFQFVVNDNMPKSGESSRLHEYMALASTTISFVGFESVIVYKLHQNSEAYKILLLKSGIWHFLCIHLHFYDDDDDGGGGDDDDDDKQDDAEKDKEHRHVGLVDTLSILIVPNAFSIRTYNIMQDDLSLGAMITCVTCTIGYVLGNCVFERWDHERKVARRRTTHDSPAYKENDNDITYAEGKMIEVGTY